VRLARVAAIAIVSLGLVGLLRQTALAEDERPEFQRMKFVERGEALTLTAQLTKLFDNAAYNALESGFTSTVLIRIWITPRDSNEPVAFVALTRQVLYNLWDEEYVLRFDEPSGRRTFKEKRKSEALRQLTALEDVPIARLANLPYEQIFILSMEVELNPVSKETLAEVRRYLSQGTGSFDRGGAFFGSFVSVFVNPKIPEADRVLRIRSQPFFRQKP
jgi:uncharacterized protein DUF4390